MFGLTKENKEIISANNGMPPGSASLDADLDKEIAIHVMPARFRAVKTGGNTKMTGLIILIVGALFLISGSVGLYYFLFLNPPVPDQAPIASTTQETNQMEAIKDAPIARKETSPVPTSTLLELLATTTNATTTNSEATATPDIEVGSPDPTLSVSMDSDRDGLTDIEEAAIGINAFSSDSDGDGYTDSAELAVLYDPAGTGKLEANLKVKKFSNSTYNYDLFYPADWQAKSQGGDFLMRFTGPNEQFFQIEVQPNTSRLSIIDWYRQEFGESAPASRLIEQKVKTSKATWFGVKSEDGMTVYLTDGKSSNIYTMSYNVGLAKVVDFPNLFSVFYNSLQFIE